MRGDDPTPKNRAWWNRTSDGYQASHGEQLASEHLGWGVWGVPESELRVLGDVAGLDVLELGCGAAQWAVALARRGARIVGVDLSERQLAHARALVADAGVAVPLVHGNAERLPFATACFDLVFNDHGATSYARLEPAVSEAARVVRPGGRFVFNVASPIRDLFWDASRDAFVGELVNDYFTLDRFEDDQNVCHQLPYGGWIRLFRSQGLVVEDLLEIRPPPDARTSYGDFVSLEWARRWPAENIWVLRKPEA